MTVFLFSNPTSVMKFIVCDSFVCTLFAQPVQRSQFKTGPGSQACAAEELSSIKHHCSQQRPQLEASLLIFPSSLPLSLLIFFHVDISLDIVMQPGYHEQTLHSPGHRFQAVPVAPHSCVLLSGLMNLFCRGFWVPCQ